MTTDLTVSTKGRLVVFDARLQVSLGRAVRVGRGAVVDANVLAVVVLLPDGDFVVATGHGQHIARQRPAHVPSDVVELVQRRLLPHAQSAVSGVVQVA